MNTKVSVLMPVYNASLYLEEAISSILNQSYSDFELIIINDGSTDNSLEIIERFSDTRIILVNNKKNSGIINARNQGLQLAKGKYIANMDADDVSLPQRFEKQVKFLDSHPETAILATRLILITPEGEQSGVWPEDYYCVTTKDIANTLPVINCIGQPTVMMRTEIVRRIGYHEKFKNNEDWGLWLSVLAEGQGIAKLSEPMLLYRQHPVSTTAFANRSGVDKKIIAFKVKYLKYKLTTNNFRGTDSKVLFSSFKDLSRWLLKKLSPRLYTFSSRLRTVNKKLFLKQFVTAVKELKALKGKVKVIYVFPSFHTGGAERVHASIVEAANLDKALTLFTAGSTNTAFYDKFSRYSTVLEINELVKLGFTERWLFRRISRLSAESPGLTCFGCNSPFFYDAIPYLQPGTTIIDLLHAFVHSYENGPEKWSLPYIDKLAHRVVISAKTKNDLQELYKKNNILAHYGDRISVISNFVEKSDLPLKNQSGNLKVAYVGRGGDEKRVDLIAQLAKDLAGAGIEFHFVGDVKQAIPETLWPYCVLHGEINNLVAEFSNLCQAINVLGEASPRALDAVAALGERLSVRVLAAAISAAGAPARWVESTRLICTDSRFQNAAPDADETRRRSQAV
ncbi:MAG TPA: glycosyltransferase, partial [Bacteroidia bacterium]|nr:glycosyltransferase [Bacteroidia bacterium]